ncbi:hypothetical protein IE53DRAFT_411117 [Violaceomyces palustris]|uniref:Uncharacterized protein n=1 Tax=Violaceomyces palustris TaxID=1673888 RepID=A0ACD0NWQ9_9BASI|nr:hypothetical protein IE53DRAFT_411117 [Violaceomyces palustris]
MSTNTTTATSSSSTATNPNMSPNSRRNLASRLAAQQPHFSSIPAPNFSHLHHQAHQNQGGATPLFELPSDSIFAQPTNPSTLAEEQQPRTYHEMPPNLAYGSVANSAGSFHPIQPPSHYGSRSRSVPPQRAAGILKEDNRGEGSSARALPPIDTKGPWAVAAAATQGKRRHLEDGDKRPTSPHITTATPTNARHTHFALNERNLAHRVASPQEDIQGTGPYIRPSRTPPVKSPPPAQHHRNLDAPTRQTSLGRVAVHAAQSLMEAVAGRVSPANFYRGAQSSHVGEGQGFEDEEEDDEAGKGHGSKRLSGGRFTPTLSSNSSRRKGEGNFVYAWSDRPQSRPHTVSHHLGHHNHNHQHRVGGFVEEPEDFQGVVDGQLREELAGSRRATPAAYRPRPGSPKKKVAYASLTEEREGLSHVVSSTYSSSTLSSHSITIGSPIVIPRARRGAVRLRPKRRKRVSPRSKASRCQRLTFRQQLSVLVSSLVGFLRLLANPHEACCRLGEWWTDQKIAWDEAFRDPVTGQRTLRPPWLQAYVPLLIWLGISLSSTAIVVTFHTKVFTALDHLANYLQKMGLGGRMILGSLIFLTTFPPLPLYSTLIILCGFSFGLWEGFIISYIAALLGAIIVFVLSRSLLRNWMVGLLSKSGGLQKVVRAIEKQPKLLFLVRLAPYPYNLMNTLLASSSTLTLKTYTWCTALALPKLLVHTGLGTSIKNFAAYNGAVAADGGEGADVVSEEDARATRTAETVKHVAGLVGVGLCVGIFIYLFSVARRAVDELDDDEESFAKGDGDEEGEELLDANGDPIDFDDDDDDYFDEDEDDEHDDEHASDGRAWGSSWNVDEGHHAPILSSGSLSDGGARTLALEDAISIVPGAAQASHLDHHHQLISPAVFYTEEAAAERSSGEPDLAEKIAEMEAHADLHEHSLELEHSNRMKEEEEEEEKRRVRRSWEGN